ncbi:unnamed protein product [Rhizoctonia solani]|uniref:F-box domain-containing protein n=1 Tax=Rhizoctonia solani TaxID=456999 RepID=A0A8H2WC04_9AGAM|nr:unnamed protein product [Rhizoctonia solani]
MEAFPNRNSHNRITIYSLPPETLTHIFSLVVLGQPCLIQNCPDPPYFDISQKNYFPDNISHVCSLWRCIVTRLPSLWPHIDIVLNHPLNPRLVARAKVFAARAGHIPLDIHIFDPDFEHAQNMRRFMLEYPRSIYTAGWMEPDTMNDFQFSSSSPIQIRSLDFNFKLRKGLRSSHMSALEYLLAKCAPGVLTHYSMQIHVRTLSAFIEPADDHRTLDSVLLAIPSQYFENVWLGTTHLRLNNLCPYWGSKAYHRLVELRLGKRVPTILEAQFVNILRSSPGLRILHIETVVEDLSPPGDSITPVNLEELVDLKINDRSEFDFTACGEILRWIAPGPKPLQLAFNGHPSEGAILFCTRSNITRFFGEAFTQESVTDMIRRCARLELLALNAGYFEVNDLYSILCPVDERNLVGLVPKTRIDTLYLVNFSVLPLHDLENAVAEYSIQRLILRDCGLSYETDEAVMQTSSPQETRRVLSTLDKCPVVEYLEARCSLDPDGW